MPAESIKSIATESVSSGKPREASAGGLSSGLPSLNINSNTNTKPPTHIPPVVEPLYQVKLLQALRSGDPALIHPFLSEIGKDKRSSTSLPTSPRAETFVTPTKGDSIDTGAAALHLAIRCASADTIALLLSNRCISPNGVHPPDSGSTPLHLAASLGRVDAVSLLLEQEGIDDTLRDKNGRTALEVALDMRKDSRAGRGTTRKAKEIVEAIHDSHAFLDASYRSLLRSYTLSPPPSITFNQSSINLQHNTSSAPPALLALLMSPRAAHIDLSYVDSSSPSHPGGLSLLHAAAERGDLRLIDLAVRAGADVWVRDRKGRLPGDWDRGKDKGVKERGEAGKGIEKVRVFLRQFASQDPSLLGSPDLGAPSAAGTSGAQIIEPPMLKGYLSKYTNVAKGYGDRWFVLKGGILSYYRHQSDETIASRGSISMRTALVKASSSDRCRFEVSSLSTPSPSLPRREKPHTLQKWYMKANHPVEAARWTAALTRSAEWARREAGPSTSASGSGSYPSIIVSPSASATLSDHLGMPIDAKEAESKGFRRRSGESDKSSIVKSVKSAGSQAHRLSGTLLRKAGRGGKNSYNDKSTSPEWASPSNSPHPGTNPTVNMENDAVDVTEDADGDAADDLGVDGDGEEDEDYAGGEESSNNEGGRDGKHPPYEEFIELHGNTLLAQTELSSQLLSSFASASNTQAQREQEIKTALQDSFSLLYGLTHEYIHMTRAREAWYQRQLEAERRRQRVWEESLATVVREGEMLEKELKIRSRKRGSRFFDTSSDASHAVGGGSTLKGRRASFLAVTLEQERVAEKQAVQGLPTTNEVKEKVPTTVLLASPVTTPTKLVASPPPRSQAFTSTSPRTSTSISGSKLLTGLALQDEEEADTTDEEDEFFDAIESGTLPNLVVPDALSSFYTASQGHSLSSSITSPSKSMVVTLPGTTNIRQYSGYTELRRDLGLKAERPRTSLWSVLKGSIGKDLTRISFPVYFNEPTSMLQRMAEDMEFSECLDAAAKEKDALKRLAFVAAFAMSNYSSTIGRIAKPFNPMLSETFEYVHLDKAYRYFSEQVSHHPPISACWAENPDWCYYGEVDAQNKFMGKSFEIRPTGIAHADLIIPASYAPAGTTYPKAPEDKYGPGKVVEHFSWKKVTTSVSGFILGSPTIDHYGDMVVTNHRTNDQCILTFKPRGWRGKDAYEIAGEVSDSSGDLVYQIAGRWNSQLIACPVTDSDSIDTALNPDLDVSPHGSPISPNSLPPNAPFLLWRNTIKPPGSPFNLTPFALTLNSTGSPPSALVPYLPPTDCRLRPDQRAFEQGLWDLANELKQSQEEKQREIRKAREEGRVPPHKPRWFMREREKDTGVGVWIPRRIGAEGAEARHDGKVEYWEERERVWKEGGKEKSKWKDLEEIFIDPPESVKIM